MNRLIAAALAFAIGFALSAMFDQCLPPTFAERWHPVETLPPTIDFHDLIPRRELA